MKSFKIDDYLKETFAHFPQAGGKPIIGITTNYDTPDATLRDRYYKQVVAAGGVPMLLPPVAEPDVIVETLERLDGLLLTGGADLNPLWLNEEPTLGLRHINAERDLPELMTIRLAMNRQIPILGICRGMQILTVVLGGHVVQDLPQTERSLRHSQDADKGEATHSIEVLEGSVLARIFSLETKTEGTSEKAPIEPEKKGATLPNRVSQTTRQLFGRGGTPSPTPSAPAPAVAGRLWVNSFHHQAVDRPGPQLRVVATAPDGVIEAVESSECKAVMGVQWHPEWLGNDGLPLFTWLVQEATLFAQAKTIHSRIITLDTHCDTPMFFPQGVRFDQRDPRLRYDLHKMTEGRQDAVTMAAYLPQPKMGEAFSSKIDLEGLKRHNPHLEGLDQQLTPTHYANLIFDRIEQIVAEHPQHLSLARTPADIYEDKRRGRKSILFAIENGLALGNDLAQVRHFAQRGVTYITLCHNGDNDICDSAKGCNTHQGVSPWGKKVIEEMNRQGIMIDLSHASEQSFYNALQLSQQPIVCSHSNCRALCNHPRNLTDDQMRALAQHGGVMHITIYDYFLRIGGHSSILHALQHLEHAIEVMGIDHVGLGTDFDGDGGVPGLNDASEMPQWTMALLRKRFSERDIAKIWGGNWLRVMAQVQAARQR